MSLPTFSAYDTDNADDKLSGIRHPHPLRANGSAENIMAVQDFTSTTMPNSPSPDPVFVSRTHPGSVQRRSFHRRSASTRSCDLTVYASSQLPASLHSTSPRFSHSPGSRPSKTNTSPQPDYPVIPIRPPLRPTVSFGSVSRHSYDSTRSIIEQKISYADEKEVYMIDNLEPPKVHDWNFYACSSCLSLLNLICEYATTALAPALPQVARDLDLSAMESFWLASSYLLLACLTQPLAMRLSMAIGSKPVLLIGTLLFVIGSIISAVATALPIILLGRSVEGLGYGATSMSTQLILSQLLAVDSRHRFKKWASCPSWVGVALGPVLGGALAQITSWRAIFYLQAALSAVPLVTLPWVLHVPITGAGSVGERLKQVDALNWILLAGGVTPLMVAISIGGVLHPWISYQVLLSMALGLVMLVFWLLHVRTHLSPILPVAIFSNMSAAVTCFGAVVHGAILTSVIFFATLLYQVVGCSTAMSGIYLISWTFGILAMSIFSTALLSRTGHRPTIWFGWGLATIAMALMTIILAANPLATSLPITLVGGIAMGILVPGLSTAMQSAASNDEEVIYSDAIHLTFGTFGKCLGVVVSSSIFLNCLKSKIFGNPNLIDDAQDSWLDATSLLDHQLAGLEERVRLNLILNYTQALRPVWIVACAAAAFALVLSVFFTKLCKPAATPQPVDLPAELEG